MSSVNLTVILFLLSLVSCAGDEALKRLCGIAFTDSVHGMVAGNKKHVTHFIEKRARNWVTSQKPLDTPIRKRTGDCLCVSAGTMALFFLYFILFIYLVRNLFILFYLFILFIYLFHLLIIFFLL
jgi:hypothetical protein